MRANAPFPILMALTGVMFASALMPLLVLASPMVREHVPPPVRRNAAVVSHSSHKRERAAAHASHTSRTTAHASGRNSARGTKHAAALKSEKHGRRALHAESARGRRRVAVKADRPDDTTKSRVHDWVKNQKASSPPEDPKTGKPVPADAPATGVSVPGTDAVPADGDSANSPAQPISVIGVIRTPDSGRPQLPPIEELAGVPEILPSLYDKRGRLVVPPAMKGSHEILIHQNQMADSDGLDRIHDDEDLARMRNTGELVAIPVNATLRVDERLPGNRRYCRPWTALFLDTMAQQFFANFQVALQVNSAVRTVAFQQRLIHTNGNAAPAAGDTASPHLTGQAVDIGKRGLTMMQIAWLRGYLLPLVQQGKVDVEEEFQQSCFHISVYKKYMPQGANRRIVAATHREGMGMPGMALR